MKVPVYNVLVRMTQRQPPLESWIGGIGQPPSGIPRNLPPFRIADRHQVLNQVSMAAVLGSVSILGALQVQPWHRRSNRIHSHGDSVVSCLVVDAVGNRSLAHIKFATNRSSTHDRLRTHVLHLCRWQDAGSNQHARGHQRVSVNFIIFGVFQCHRSYKLQRVAPFLAVLTDVLLTGLASEHKRSLLPRCPLAEIFEKPLFANPPKLNYGTFAMTQVALDPYQYITRCINASCIHCTKDPLL